MFRLPKSSAATRTALAGVVGLAATCAVGVATPAQAAQPQQPKQPVRVFTVACAEPGDASDFGAAIVTMTFMNGSLRKHDSFVVVPVNDTTGLDAGDRISVDRKQRRAVIVIPADGTALTPATTVEVRLGGDIVQRIPVPAGCGAIDPSPARGPDIGPITSSGGAVTVPITNRNSVADEVGVTLYPAEGNTGNSRFLTLGPGEIGTVTFPGVPAGQYFVEAYGYTTFTQSSSDVFTVS